MDGGRSWAGLRNVFIINSFFFSLSWRSAFRTTFGGMKRWGLRATSLSSYTNLDAWQNTRVTT